MPEKLEELKRLWLIEAVRYNVLPLDDRRVERFNSDLAGRPVLVHGRSQILYGGMGRLSENSVINLKNKSHSVTAELIVSEGGGHGVLIAQGGAFGGLGALPAQRQAEVLLQPRRTRAPVRRGRYLPSQPESTRSGWSSPTTAAASGRAER